MLLPTLLLLEMVIMINYFLLNIGLTIQEEDQLDQKEVLELNYLISDILMEGTQELEMVSHNPTIIEKIEKPGDKKLLN